MASPVITSKCCLALSALLGSKIVFPNSTDYVSSLGSYYSAKSTAVQPQCIVVPETAEDVSVAVHSLTSNYKCLAGNEKEACKFAIRSGGHSSVPEASNIAGGVTIDLRQLNTVEVDQDTLIVSIGGGNIWDAVYEKIDELNLSVVGGRTAHVGVGGLSVGGGVSYYSPRYGWASDTIVNYQVVLANGSVVNANNEENQDLLWALRGGGNNLGVVTRMDMQGFEQGPFLGGQIFRQGDSWYENIQEFVKINSVDNYDEYAHIILSWGQGQFDGNPTIVNHLDYTKPGVENPPIFERLRSLPSFFDTMRTTTVTQLARDLKDMQKDGKRQYWVSLTFKSSEELLNSTFIHYNETLSTVSGVTGILFNLSLQPLPPKFYKRNAKANPFGLDTREGALVMAILTASYDSAADDKTIETASLDLMGKIQEVAQRLGALDPFLYMNYAAAWQDPFAGYGEKNLKRLRSIAKKVDPNSAFQYQVPGGFKLFR